jgi:hypothetical protein
MLMYCLLFSYPSYGSTQITHIYCIAFNTVRSHHSSCLGQYSPAICQFKEHIFHSYIYQYCEIILQFLHREVISVICPFKEHILYSDVYSIDATTRVTFTEFCRYILYRVYLYGPSLSSLTVTKTFRCELDMF